MSTLFLWLRFSFHDLHVCCGEISTQWVHSSVWENRFIDTSYFLKLDITESPISLNGSVFVWTVRICLPFAGLSSSHGQGILHWKLLWVLSSLPLGFRRALPGASPPFSARARQGDQQPTFLPHWQHSLFFIEQIPQTSGSCKSLDWMIRSTSEKNQNFRRKRVQILSRMQYSLPLTKQYA